MSMIFSIYSIFSKNISTFFQKPIDKSLALCYNITVPLMNVINNCWCGSMAEHLICNQAVDGSTPFTSSIFGGFPERPKGADCKSVVTDFGGPNPPSPTRHKHLRKQVLFSVNFGPSERVKYADACESLASEPEIRLRRVKERILFHIDQSRRRREIFHNFRKEIISHSAQAEYFT